MAEQDNQSGCLTREVAMAHKMQNIRERGEEREKAFSNQHISTDWPHTCCSQWCQSERHCTNWVNWPWGKIFAFKRVQVTYSSSTMEITCLANLLRTIFLHVVHLLWTSSVWPTGSGLFQYVRKTEFARKHWQLQILELKSKTLQRL